MKQIARNATMDDCGALRDCRYLLLFKPLALPARSPNLNAYAERWVRSVKEECLSKVILFGKRSLLRALSNYVDHFHAERNHQGKGNVLLLPSDWVGSCASIIVRQREGASVGPILGPYDICDDVDFNQFIDDLESELARRGMTQVKACRTITVTSELARLAVPLEANTKRITEGAPAGWAPISCKGRRASSSSSSRRSGR